MNRNKNITALYCRLSKDDGTNTDSMSIQSQKDMLSRYAKDNGFLNCEFYVDDGFSGTNFRRPSFQKMIKDIESGLVSSVITKDLSRLGRNYLETGTYIEVYFPKHHVRYVAINDGVDSANDFEMDITPFKNILNEMYAKDISKKIKSARMARAKAGKFVSSIPPIGYMRDPNDKTHLIIDEKTAPIIRKIYAYALDGVGAHIICNRLREEEIPRPAYHRGRSYHNKSSDQDKYYWAHGYISMILRNPIYTGHLEVLKTPNRSVHSTSKVYIPPSKREVVYNTHEPIISQENWDAVQKIVSSHKGIQAKEDGYDNIFKGLLFCRDCGYSLSFKTETRRKKAMTLQEKTFYCCTLYRSHGKGSCSEHKIEAVDLYNSVLYDIRKHAKVANIDREKLSRRIIRQKNIRMNDDKAELERELLKLKKRCSEIEDSYASLYDNLSKGILTDNRFKMMSERFDDEQKNAELRIAEIEEQLKQSMSQTRDVESFIDEISMYADITELNPKILNILIDKIEISEREVINGMKTQKIRIFYNFVGDINTEE